MHAVQDRGGLRHAFLRGSRYALWAITFCVVPLIIYRGEFVSLYIGDRFAITAFLLGAMLAPMVIRFATFMTGHLASASANLRPLALRGIVVQAAIVALTLYFVVARQMGAAGTGLAMLIAGRCPRTHSDLAARIADGGRAGQAVAARDRWAGVLAGADRRRVAWVRPALARGTKFVVTARDMRRGWRNRVCRDAGRILLVIRTSAKI